MIKLIASETVTSNVSSYVWDNIPQTYTDLIIWVSARGSETFANGGLNIRMVPNNSNTNLSFIQLLGDSTNATNSSGTAANAALMNVNGDTANLFSASSIYISNYTGSDNKIWTAEGVTENNGTTAYQTYTTGQWAAGSAITSIRLEPIQTINITMQAGSSFSLYGVLKGTSNGVVVS